jgi:type III restriction enzyme
LLWNDKPTLDANPPNLLNLLSTQLEAEGIGVATTKTNPRAPVIIAPVQERLGSDIAIPITKLSLEHDLRKLSDLKIETLDAIYDQAELATRSVQLP